MRPRPLILGILLLALLSTSAAALPETYSYLESWVVENAPSENSQFGGMTSHGGSVYLADSGSQCIRVFSSTGALEHIWDMVDFPGFSAGPYFVAVNSSGYIYATAESVGEPLIGRVYVLNPVGGYEFSWSQTEPGEVPQSLGDPRGIAIGRDEHVFVADSRLHQVDEFTHDGTFVRTYGGSGSGEGEFIYPLGVAAAPNGAIFVCDAGNYRIVRFLPGSDWSSSWLAWPFSGTIPYGAATDTQGSVFITNAYLGVYTGIRAGHADSRQTRDIGAGEKAVYKYSASGALLASFGEFPGFGFISAGPNSRNSTTRISTMPAPPYRDIFMNPSGIAVDPSGRVRVTDSVLPVIETYIRPVSGPVAAFSGSPQSGGAPLTVVFLDYSTGASTWSWDFGDDTNSTAQNPTHVYTAPGLYTVSLTVTDGAGGTATETKYGYIQVTGKPTADFEANVTSGRAALAVQFTSNTTGATAWTWYFGDGSTSTEQHPVHVYTTPGVYSVWLVASTPGYGSVIVSKPGYIRVTDPPAVDFVMNVTNGTVPLAVRFTDTSTGAPFSWWWDFGDGGYSFEQHPTHTFTMTGNHTITLTAHSVNGSGQVTHNVTVEPIVTPTPTMTASPTATPTVSPTATVGPTHTPYRSVALPGRVEAEDYDLGGEGVAYHDGTPGNIGGIYRKDDVDVERIDTGDPTPNVGWIRIGEYLTYTVNVSQAGTYDMTCRVSSNRTGRSFEVYLDGETAPRTRVAVPKTVTTTVANVSVPYTVEWPYFTNVVARIELPAGWHTLRFNFPMDYLNLNWMEFTPRAA